MATLEQILIEAQQLSARDKLRLIEQLALAIEEVVESSKVPPQVLQPYPSLWGVLSHLGPGPSEEDITEARRQMWGNFPRGDI